LHHVPSQGGFGQASPDGRRLAVEFADLSWSQVNGQVSDIWLLDLRTRRWRRLPGMPLITAVKFMSMAWTGPAPSRRRHRAATAPSTPPP
jgi:hypothetical protein